MREGGADRTPGPVHLGSLANTALSDMIRHKRLRADDAIVEARLAETLGVSRTPLREALQRLEGEGMVVKGGRSYMVRRVDLGEYLKSLKVRQVMEPEAAALAVGQVPGLLLATVRGEILHCSTLPPTTLTRIGTPTTTCITCSSIIAATRSWRGSSEGSEPRRGCSRSTG